MSTATDFVDWICDNHRITSEGSSWECFRQYQQLYTDINGLYMDKNDYRAIKSFHDTVTVIRFGLWKPNVNGKPVASLDSLLALLIYNIAYDAGCRTQRRASWTASGLLYLFASTGARAAEIVDNEPAKPKDGSWDELYGRKAIGQDDEGGDDKAPDEHSRLLEDLLY
ncbi:hypothetical protein IL306_009274 [Fusarium sp. DS 682]|nr:hypothetical protein IL306_009274 [Fusarium sp. DS 682]